MGHLPPPQHYTFVPDTNIDGEVDFQLGMIGDPNELRRRTQDQGLPITYVEYLPRLQVLHCRTSRELYEQLFRAKLGHEPDAAGTAGYSHRGFWEIQKGSIPKDLGDLVLDVHLYIAHRI